MAEFEENNDFDQLRNLLEGAEIAPSRDLWPEIESKLEKSPRRPFIWWFSIAGLLLSVTLITAYFYTNSNDKNMQLSNNNIKVGNYNKVLSQTITNKNVATDNNNYQSETENEATNKLTLKSNNRNDKNVNLEQINNEKQFLKENNNTLNDIKNNVNGALNQDDRVNVGKSLHKKSNQVQNKNAIDGTQSSDFEPKKYKLNGVINNSTIVNKTTDFDRNNEKYEALENKVSNLGKEANKTSFNKSVQSKGVGNQVVSSGLDVVNLNRTYDNSDNVNKISNILNTKQSEASILNNLILNKTQVEVNDKKVNDKLNYLMVKTKPLVNDSLKFKEKDVLVTNRKNSTFNSQKSYDIISSVNYFYNNNYKPESNLLITNSYKYGILVNYYINKNWGLGFGIVQNSIFYNSVLLEQQYQTVGITSIKEVKLPDSSYTLQQKDSSIAKINEVANFKSLQIKSVNIPFQLLFKFKINNKFSVENRVGVVTSFASSQSRKITRTVGFSYQHNLNLLYSLTPKIQLLFGPEYSFYITDLVQNKSGWYPLGLHIGARINLK